MIKRLPKQGSPVFQKLQVGLFDGLGEIYRSRLKHFQSATQAYEIAQQLDPKNEMRGDGTDRAEILAELYLVSGPDYADKAVEQHMKMLRNEPFKYDSYKALAASTWTRTSTTRRWCMCAPWRSSRRPTRSELQFYEQYKPRGLVKAKSVMSPDTWAKLIHPDENRYISAIFGAVWQGVAAMKAFPHKELGVKRKDKRSLPGDPLMFSKLFYYVAQVLNVPLPEVFLVEDNKPADIQLANFDREAGAVPVVRGPSALAARQERARDRVPVGTPPDLHAARVLPEAAAAHEHRAQGGVLSAIAMVQPRTSPFRPTWCSWSSSTAGDAEADAAAGARAARCGRPPLHPGGARDQPREVGSRGRCGLASRGLRGVRGSRGRGADGVGGAGRRRWSAGEGQDQGARPLLDLRGVLHGPLTIAGSSRSAYSWVKEPKLEQGTQRVALASGGHVVIDVRGQGPLCLAHPGGPGLDSSYLHGAALEKHFTVVYIDPLGTGSSSKVPPPEWFKDRPWHADAMKAIEEEDKATDEASLNAVFQREVKLYFADYDGKRPDYDDLLRKLHVTYEVASRRPQGKQRVYDVRGKFGRLHTTPTLIVTGDRDFSGGPVPSNWIQQSIADSKLVVIPNAGHFAHVEQPAAFEAAVAQFADALR
jgi:pimeloyl-ACP methyl ester carboxylesterase